MRALQEIKETCEEFIWQPEAHLLLVGGADSDVPYVLKVLEQIQGEDDAALYLMFADGFVDAQSYAFTFAQRCEQLYEVANAERAERKEDPLEPFPKSMVAPRTPPRQRIVQAIEHLGARLPNPEEFRVVIALLPMTVQDWGAFAKFVSELAKMPPPAPPHNEDWPAYTRILLRDDRAHALGAELARRGAQGLLSTDVDVSTEALAADLSEDAVDPAVPVFQRMQAVMQLANIDLSYKRYEEASRKFAILYDYYEKSGAPIMQAMTLQGAGDCYARIEQNEQALMRYQQGMALAMAAKSPVPLDPPPQAPDDDSPPGEPLHPNAPPVLLNLLLSAAGICMLLRKYEDACSYYESATKVAAKCMNPIAAADALQGQGDAHRALEQLSDALKVWKDCETIAQAYEYYERMVSVLERMLALYEAGQMRKETNETRARLDGARLLQKKKAS